MNFLRSLPAEILNYLSFTVFTTLLVSLQSSLWLQFFGFFPAPYLWIPILTYWAITRGWVRGFIMVYLLSMVLFTFTGHSLELIFFTTFALFFLIYMIRDRIMWKGHSYFALNCFIATLAHPLLVISASYFFDSRPVKQFLFWDWIMSPLLTALVAVGLYNFIIWLDRISMGQTNEDPETDFL